MYNQNKKQLVHFFKLKMHSILIFSIFMLILLYYYIELTITISTMISN